MDLPIRKYRKRYAREILFDSSSPSRTEVAIALNSQSPTCTPSPSRKAQQNESQFGRIRAIGANVVHDGLDLQALARMNKGQFRSAVHQIDVAIQS
jgi:hypothetical protein